MPQVLRTQKQNGKAKPKTRLPYVTWTWKKSQKQDGPGTEIRIMGEKKMEKYFIYRCGNLD